MQDLHLKDCCSIVNFNIINVWTNPLITFRKDVVKKSFALLGILLFLNLGSEEISAQDSRHSRQARTLLALIDRFLEELDANILTHDGSIRLVLFIIRIVTSQANRHGLALGRHVVGDIVAEVWLIGCRGSTHQHWIPH